MSLITKWAFRNKAAVSIITVLLLGLGLLSYKTLPMEFFPAADQPQVSVVVLGQGTDSTTMEKQVTTPIEMALEGVKGKNTIYSSTGDGFSKVDILYDSKTNMKDAKLEVQEALATLTLPSNVMKPNVIQLNTNMIPISQISITFEDGLTQENVDFAKKELLPSIKDIDGIASIQTMGEAMSYISIEIDNQKLASSNIPLQSVMTLLQGHNSSMAVAEETIDNKSSNIKVVGNIDSLAELKDLPVAPGVTLADIATVKETEPTHVLTHINGEDGLFLVVTKDASSNAVSIAKEIDKTITELNKEYPNSETTVIVDTTDMVETSVNTMMKEVLLGALFATIVIMLFLRNLRSTFITIVSIPLSLAVTLYLLSRSGITLNVLTLGGVAVAVGRLVDDSIVVIENIFRKMQKEPFSVSMIIEATKEVGTAITASTLTTVAVFLPIGLVSGSLQDILLPFALTVTYSLLASLLVALTVVPLMSAGLLKTTKLPEHKPPVRFMKMVTWSLNHKWIVLVLSAVMFVGSIGAYFVLPKGAVDQSSSDFITATLEYPNDTPLEKVKEKALQLESFILEQEEVKYTFTQLGNSKETAQWGDVSSPTSTRFSIILKNKEDTTEMIERIEKEKANFSGAELTVQASGMMSSSSSQMTIDVMGDSFDDISETALDVKAAIRDIDGVEEVSTNFEEKKMVYSINVDSDKANSEQTAQQVAMMLNQLPLGSIQLEGQETPVMLEPMLAPKKAEDLDLIPVMTSVGMLTVSDIGTIEQKEEPTSVFHKDGDPYVRVSAMVDPAKLSEIAKEMNIAIFGEGKSGDGLEIPDNVDVFIGGASSQQAEDFADLFMTMMVSIGAVFLIMVITFKTLRAPIAILFSLPLAAIGAVLGLIVSRIPVDITALLGALMLIGIVVTNAIVLIDRVKQNEEKMMIRDAIVEAAGVRMRPILMTAVATICAMLPLLFKKAETGALVSQSLAVVVIGGLAAATLLTLVVIPVIYELLHFKKSKKQRLSTESTDTLNL